MTDKLFLDTNILVYAYDSHDLHKQAIAQALLTTSIEQENGVISVQVLGEFFTVVTKHIKQPMSVEEAQQIIGSMSILPVQEIDLSLVNRAIVTHSRYKISYWDALIVSAAERSNCEKIVTEDLNDDQTYHGITAFNPFR